TGRSRRSGERYVFCGTFPETAPCLRGEKPRRTLSGTVSPWSPDFPRRLRAAAARPTDRIEMRCRAPAVKGGRSGRLTAGDAAAQPRIAQTAFMEMRWISSFLSMAIWLRSRKILETEVPPDAATSLLPPKGL